MGTAGADFGGGVVASGGLFEAGYTSSLGYRFARVSSGGAPRSVSGIAVTTSDRVYLTGLTQTYVDFGFGRATSHGGLDMWTALLP